MIKKYDCSVIGLDSNQRTLNRAKKNAEEHTVSLQDLSFLENISSDMLNSFDVVISLNSFEHFSKPEKVLSQMTSLLRKSGVILLNFGPPWFAPYGSHMHFFCKVPWVHVFFPEDVVMRARSHFRSDGAKRYEDVESGLNKMSIAKFESILSSSKLKVNYLKYECVKGINWLSKVPLIREFFINRVVVSLSRLT